MSSLLRLLGGALVATLLVVGCQSSRSTSSPSSASSGPVVLAEYADSSITVDQFERRYTRTIGHPDTLGRDSVPSFASFLKRYLDFRLKVQAARDADLDTMRSLRAEARSYRRQLARPTLLRQEVIEPVVRQLYERRSTDVRARHLLIRVPENASPADTLRAYREIQTLADSLDDGVSLGDLAYRHSDDPSAKESGQRGYRGDLGYLTAGQIVAPFENAMYETPVDSVSRVFRTRFGYHILKVEDRRPRPRPVQLSHILIRPDSTTRQDTVEARRLADSLRTALRSGSSFRALARAHSDDRRSARRGGDLGTVQPGSNLPTALQETVRDLPVDSVSDVVGTRYGFHLLKVNGREPRPSFTEAYDNLKQQASRLPRIKNKEADLAADVRRRNQTRVDTTALLSASGLPALDTTSRALLPPSQDPDTSQTPIASIGDSTYTFGAYSRYVATTNGAASQPVATTLDRFLNDRAIDYAAARLEQRDPEFSARMQEYRDGLLLFQYMQDSVWTAAAQDTALLREVYRRKKDTYSYPKRVRTLTFSAPDDSLTEALRAAYASSTDRRAIVRQAASDSLIRVDTVFVTDRSTGPYASVTSVADGAGYGPVAVDGESVYLIRDAKLPARPKSFDEARSTVVRDAQDAYEASVLDSLRARYDARTYPDRLRYAFPDAAVSDTTAAR